MTDKFLKDLPVATDNAGAIFYGEQDNTSKQFTRDLLVGDPGPQGPAGADGQGVPVGGAADQILTKIDVTDYNTEWRDAPKDITLDTRENIIALAGEDGDQAYATDTKQFYFYDSGWQEQDTLQTERSGSVDIGVVQNSSLSGYGLEYITDKRISNCAIGENVDPKEGAVRVTFANSLGRNIAQYYLDGDWRTALTGVNIQTDSEETPPDIEFTDFSPWILSLITGNSDVKDVNGTPVVQQMQTDIGAVQSPLVIFGGTF